MPGTLFSFIWCVPCLHLNFIFSWCLILGNVAWHEVWINSWYHSIPHVVIYIYIFNTYYCFPSFGSCQLNPGWSTGFNKSCCWYVLYLIKLLDYMLIIFHSLTKIFVPFFSSFQRDNLKVLLKILKIWSELMLRR